MTAIIEQLKAVPLFQGMTDNALEAVAGLATEVEFADGQTVTREGEEGDSFFVLVDGQLRVSRNGGAIRDLGPGDFLGEISLIDGRPRSATTVAMGRVKALVVYRPAFLELMDRFGAVRLGILMALTDRIRSDEHEVLV
jgi:CRP/FNR family cyclic AMP-dependent transcriptional regulator